MYSRSPDLDGVPDADSKSFLDCSITRLRQERGWKEKTGQGRGKGQAEGENREQVRRGMGYRGIVKGWDSVDSCHFGSYRVERRGGSENEPSI